MFDIDKLIENAKKELKELEKVSSPKNDVGVSYLPDGTHKMRIVPINNKLVYTARVHKYKVGDENRNLVCPGEGCPMCAYADEIDNWRLKARNLNKSLVYLLATDSEDKYWIPGSYYILVSTGNRFKKALLNYISSTAGASEEGKKLVSSLLDPTKEVQGSFMVQVQSGQQGYVNVSYDPLVKSPVLDLEKFKDLDLEKAYIDFTKVASIEQLQADVNVLKGNSTDTASTEPSQAPQTTEAPTSQAQDKPECYGNANPRDAKCLQCPVLAECLQTSMSAK